MTAEPVIAATTPVDPQVRGLPRVIIVSESLPFPTLKGGDHRTWQNVNVLASCAHVGVFGLCSNDRRRDRVPEVPLAFWTTATDAAVAYPPPKGVSLPARAWLFDPAGHPSDLHFSEGAARELSALLESFRPDIAVIEGLWLHRYLDIVRASGCRIVLDCHNVEAAVFHELAGTNDRQDLEGRVIRDVLPARTVAIERKAVCEADQVWVCSGEDERRVREMYEPPTPIVVVPNGIHPGDHDAGPPRNAPSSPTLVFPGFYAYIPNVFAAMFLIEEIFPRLVAAHQEFRLLLVGAMPSEEMRAAAARDARIVVTGAVRDVRPYLAEATAIAVPLFHGGGTRLKILEAFAAGLPVISTAKGAEGLEVDAGTHLLIAETADEFVDATLAVWRDARLAARLTAHAKALVAERFSWQTIGRRIHTAVNALSTDA
jgi:glycosyltransferase involved in cell wall biosynthesis